MDRKINNFLNGSVLLLATSILFVLILLNSCEPEPVCPFQEATRKANQKKTGAALEVTLDFKRALGQLLNQLDAKQTNRPDLEIMLGWLNNQQEETYWGSELVERFNLHNQALCNIYFLSRDSEYLKGEQLQLLKDSVINLALEWFKLAESISVDSLDGVEGPGNYPIPPVISAPVYMTFIVPADMEDAVIILDGAPVVEQEGSTRIKKVIKITKPGAFHEIVFQNNGHVCRKRFAASPTDKSLQITNCKKNQS